MVRACCVSKCGHRDRVDQPGNSDACHMMRFPSDVVTCRAWIKALGLAEFLCIAHEKMTHRIICSCHFKDSDLNRTGKRISRRRDSIPITPKDVVPLIDEQAAQYPLRKSQLIPMTRTEVLISDEISETLHCEDEYGSTSFSTDAMSVPSDSSLNSSPGKSHMIGNEAASALDPTPVSTKRSFSTTGMNVDEHTSENASHAFDIDDSISTNGEVEHSRALFFQTGERISGNVSHDSPTIDTPKRRRYTFQSKLCVVKRRSQRPTSPTFNNYSFVNINNKENICKNIIFVAL